MIGEKMATSQQRFDVWAPSASYEPDGTSRAYRGLDARASFLSIEHEASPADVGDVLDGRHWERVIGQLVKHA